MATDVSLTITESTIAVDSTLQEELPEATPTAIRHSDPIHVRLVGSASKIISHIEKRVPIYSASSYASLMSQTAAFYIDPLRDIYEVGLCEPLSMNEH